MIQAMLEEVKNDFIGDLGTADSFEHLDMLAAGNSRFLKDLRVNFKNVLGSAHLSEKEGALLGLALAVNARNPKLRSFFTQRGRELGCTDDELAEAVACAALLASNNVLYRFRHFVGKEKYQQMPAGLKMNIMLRPVLGKELFELLSLAVSAVNGCERCVTSHEHSLRELGTSEERIFDAIRLASVMNSMDRIFL